MTILRMPYIAAVAAVARAGSGSLSTHTAVGDDLPAQAEAVRYARTAVMSMSIVPWHAPLKISVCMVPESDPSGWGV